MKTHTSSFKEQIKLMGKEIDSRITFGDTVLGKDDLNAVTPSYQGTILKSVMKQLDIDSNVAIPIGTILKYEFGLKVNGEYEYINYGNYVVYSIEKQEDTNSYKITCYDKLLYSMLDYVKLPITYPISIRDYINAISTTLGLKFANKSGTFANYNKQIQTDLYDGLGYTFRDILDELAQVTASTICLNNNDELEIRYITETNDTIDEEFLKDVNVNFGEKFGAVNTIVLSRSAGSDNIYYPTVLPTNPYEIKISDNQIMNGNDRVDFLPDIYNKLNGLEFYTNDFVSTGIIYYDLCDRYSVKVGDNTYSCVMFNDEILVTQGLEENVYTELPKQTETDYKKADTTDRRINQAYAILDKQNKKFEVLVSEVNSNEEKIGSLEITTGNISTKVSSVEKNLTTTNTNLSNLSGKVDTLSNDINGVSADFEDFKDNEYINTIQNIQDQLDGAIQFWSGTEVPTLNNFPANQWNTEALRNEHQGDIYDVLQGETIVNSYKFIKIDNEYQWRLVSDSEIAAVRQLAQEALEKANKNATEIGTIKTRVSSLEQTDEQIKASVESIDKQIIPTASVSGSNIYVEDASDNPLTYLEIDGRSTQETRSGKNVIDITSLRPRSATQGGTVSFVGDKAYVSSANQPWAGLNHELVNIKSSTDYHLHYVVSDFVAGSDNTKTGYELHGFKADGTQITLKNTQTINSNRTIDVDFNTQDCEKIRFWLISNNTATNITNTFTITELIICEKNLYNGYERYGASPSPDYPSEIKSVGYDNLVYDATYSSGRANYWSLVSVQSTNIVEGETYTVSVYLDSEGDSTVYWNESSGVIPYKGFRISKGLNRYTYTFTAKKTVSSIGIILSKADTNDNYLITPSKLQIEKGAVAHSYIPYGKYAIDIKTIGKNKLNKNIVAKGYRLGSDGNPFAESGYWLSDYIEVKSSSKYVYSRKGVGGSQAYAFYDKNKNFISRSFMANLTKIDISTTDTTKYIRITDLNDSLDVAQLEEGSNATEYQPYQERISVIVLNEPLRSLPNGVKDIAYIRNGKLYVDRYTTSMILNGTENWAKSTRTDVNRYYVNGLLNTTSNRTDVKSICSHFKSISQNQSDMALLGITTMNTDGIMINIDKNNTNFDTLEKFKTWLSNNNSQYDYQLATPYTEEIGEIQMPSTFKGVNHINTTDELEPTLNIEYVRDTKLSNYVEGQINKVMTIEERHYSELVIEDDNIKASVESVNSSLNGLNTTINRVEEITTDNSQVINVISTNIDKTSGEVREVTTTTGFTFNADGMTIDDGSGFKAQHRSDGTYYKDGESVVGQYTKDGSKQKDLELFGTYSYGKESIDDTPMFVGQLYTDANGERGFGHFYNGEG